MTTRPPARVGDAVAAVDTPALLVDLDALERNLQKMAAFARKAGVRLRPHAKTHKCPPIALRQIALGAVGVCCQKVSEAEAMAAGGVHDILISNEIVGEVKVARLAALARQAHVTVLADHPDMVAAYGAAARRFGAELAVLVDLHSEGIRAGVEPGPAALDLARRVADEPGLRFAGLQAYQGSAQHIRVFAERRAASERWIAAVATTKALLADNGLVCELVTGAGTGTHAFEGTSGVFNEIQPGSYTVMDVGYGLILAEGGQPVTEFENSLFILATVMSRNFPDFAVVDAGTKAGNIDSAMPTVWERPGLTYVSAADEHGAIKVASGGNAPHLGEKLRLVPGHCDPTINLYDWIIGVRHDTVEVVWPVAARGAVL
jgi:D-serine deaminase-like pyridoxal phosphate-dependent protein